MSKYAKKRREVSDDTQPAQSTPEGIGTPSSEGPMQSDAKAQTQRKCVLVVDDERDYRTIIERQLDSDYEIYAAQNGSEALSVLVWMYGEGKPPAVIITDQMMPIMDGDEFIAKVRKITKGLRFIMITSNTDITMDTLVPGGKPDRLIYKTDLLGSNGLQKAVTDLLGEQRGAQEE